MESTSSSKNECITMIRIVLYMLQNIEEQHVRGSGNMKRIAFIIKVVHSDVFQNLSCFTSMQLVSY